MKRQQHSIGLVACLLLFIYVASYYATVKLPVVRHYFGSGPWYLSPEYKIGGTWAKRAFLPVHKLDRELRKDYWQVTADELFHQYDAQ